MSKKAMFFTPNNGGQTNTRNTFIGGLGTEVSDENDLASLFDFNATDVTDFLIDSDNNISFRINKSYSPDYNAFNTLKSGLFSNSITYYIDRGGFVNSGLSEDIGITSMFYAQTNLHTLWMPNATSSGSDLLRQCYGLTYVRLDSVINLTGGNQFRINDATLSQLKRIYIPKATTIQSSNVFKGINSGTVIYHESTMSANSELLEAQNTYGAVLKSVSNFTPPNEVSDLSASLVGNSSLDLLFTTPTSTNSIEFYEVWIDDNTNNSFQLNTIYQEITASGASVTGLNAGTNYNIRIVSCDEYWNRSGYSNTINVTTT